MKILVAGGAGFLGSHLCDRLTREGHDVTALDNLMTGRLQNLTNAEASLSFSFWSHDVTEPLPSWVLRERFDRIYNLACPASPPVYQRNPEHTMLTCVVGAQQLLALAAQHGARYLQASTSEVYGDPEEHPQRESYLGAVNVTGPRACYDEGKRAAESLCLDFDRHQRCEVRIARIFNTYGPRMRPDDGRVVSSFIDQALRGEELTVFGPGDQTRSLCYVQDTIEGLVALMEHNGPQPGPVNIGNPAELSVMQLAVQIIMMTGSPSMIVNQRLPQDDPRRRCPDVSKAAALLGWKPTTNLQDGLLQTIIWCQSQQETST